MSKQAYEAVLAAVKFGAKLDRSVSNEIASGMKAWAMEMGIADGSRPTDPATRAEVWTMLQRLAERPT